MPILSRLLICSLLAGCHATVKDRLLYGDLKPDKDYCAIMKRSEAPALSAVLKPFADQLRRSTGIWVLEDGAGAMVSRAWLADAAEKTIDIQYFIFSSDNVGLIAVDYLLRAADRGVKVRLMIDDLLYDTDAYLLQALDAHPNLEVKVYNPSLKTGKNLPVALTKAALDFRGANQRMHNKTFIVDGQAVITGGRNVADEYFDFNLHYNFRDRDVLLLGKSVEQVNESFQQFWQDKRSARVGKLMGETPQKEARQLWTQLRHFACDPNHFWPQVRARIDRVPKVFGKLVEAGEIHFVDDVIYVSDDPGKNPGKEGLGGGGLSTTTLIEIVKAAKKKVVIQTPYLITTELSERLFAAATKRGVRVIIMTNSMATTDGLAAFRGYQRVRQKLLKAGVELYEFRPDARIRRDLLSSSVMKTLKKLPVFGLHAKTMVVDDELLVIGTFNLDPRSANLNTEGLVLIPSKAASSDVMEWLDQEMNPDNSYKVTKKSNGDRHSPLMLRFRVWLTGLVPAAIL